MNITVYLGSSPGNDPKLNTVVRALGRLGTFEEISEVMSRVALHKLVAPCILYNLDGYYEGLRAQLTHMVKMGLCIQEKLENIHFAADLAEIKTILAKK